MQTVTSISGGQTSAFLAARYPTDHNVFSLVCTDDVAVQYPDQSVRQYVSDKIGREFIGTLEDDKIIRTIVELEQHIGRSIQWVCGDSFEKVIEKKGGFLPNKMMRFCTTELKMKPIFDWWQSTIGTPVEMAIGFRANEKARAKRMLDQCDENGLTSMRAIVGKRGTKNKWDDVPWRKPVFPLIDDNVFRDTIVEYWKGQKVTFAEYNNCVGCFHRSPLMLRMMFDKQPEKMAWFKNAEDSAKGRWRSDMTLEQIANHKVQTELDFDDFGPCDSGHCGL